MKAKVLLFTVGMGDQDRVLESLMTPLMKSILQGDWERLIALPSQKTTMNVEALRKLLPKRSIEVETLPSAGMEENVDKTFAFYDGLIGRLLEAGFDSRELVVDFTRGTKAMSAALVLAATGRGVGTLRYVGGDKRDKLGLVIPGSEKLHEISADLALTRRNLEVGKGFIRSCQFQAVQQLFPFSFGSNHPFKAEVDALLWAACFWGSWDAFDWDKAAMALPPPAGIPADLSPVREHLKFVVRLGGGSEEDGERLSRARDRCADMFASCRRRVYAGQWEDAFIRCYRALEMIGQVRLISHGLNSEDLDASHPAVRKGIDEKVLFRSGRYINAGRDKVTWLLLQLSDPFGVELGAFDRTYSQLQVSSRNNSILIHGKRKAASEEKLLKKSIVAIEDIFKRENPKNVKRLQYATFPWMQGTQATP